MLHVGCNPHESHSVHLPLVVGNRWVYDVVSDTIRDSAVLEVIADEAGIFTLSAHCTTGHWSEPRSGMLCLQCRDSILMVQDTEPGSHKAKWYHLLADDPAQSVTQTLLLFRTFDDCGPPAQFSPQPIGTLVVNGDSYQDCLQLHCRYIDSWWVLIAGGTDSIEAEEIYCPEVGLVSFSRENHWSGWFFFGSGWSDSGVAYDTWRLRDYHLTGE